MKILNLYCGIGGNRKNWGNSHQITAVENNPEIAKIYQDFFPKDKVIVADAHQYLLEHYKEFDFIWSSPPCPSHSSFRKDFSCNVGAKAIYPDMKLYEEILLLQGYFKGKYVVENVISWYKPLIAPMVLQRHYFWTNFIIADATIMPDTINLTGGKNEDANVQIKRLEVRHDFNLDKYKVNKRLVLRNCVNPELGKHILDCAMGKIKQRQLL
ncbi:MAG: DNA cytosine methyltransferase [Candidatus Beckwithbacteria bacterium]|uniref:Putative methyltransferase n=1 Tax=viral metagenome TaxID=1070528 RepID=A0A6M3XN16_9ZZZZ